jgi:RNA polymerase sigma factor (sigma-70 family)
MSRSSLAAEVRYLRKVVASQCHQEDSDERLLHAFVMSRDEAAFAALVRRYGPMVGAVCRRVLGHEQDAEDVFQATFLVLARNAARLRKTTALASFLHGTAYRIALNAKRTTARRRKHEGQVPARPSLDPTDELSWREVRALVDEEVARLPEKYRSAFILCCLESVSQAEAAQRLGIKEGTLSSRLTRARKRLGQRLTRRGVDLTAVLTAIALSVQSASALSPMLIATTIEPALATAAGEKLASVVSASVAEMVKNATAAMMVSKAKIVTVVVLAVSMLAGAGVWAYRSLPVNAPSAQAAEPPAVKSDEKLQTTSPKRETMKNKEIEGRVLDPNGKPKAGAKILLLGEDDKLQQLGETTAEGRFAVALPQGTKGRFLIAQAEGSGIDLLPITKSDPKKPIELRLVKDQAIRGRVVTTEGKPVRGARVAVKMIDMYANNSPDSLLLAWKKGNPSFGYPFGEKIFWSEEAALLRTTTDADGCFALHGIGCERLAKLNISGAGIADTEIRVVTRAGFDPRPYNQATHDNTSKSMRRFAWMLHGVDVALAVEAEKPIRGTVKDADSGKGRPNVMVYLTRREGNGLLEVCPTAKTDAQGRYEIHGARKAKRYMLEAMDDPSAGYVSRLVWAEDTAGYDPITADIPVKKGVIVTGKVIDGATGKPIPGLAQAAVLYDNPFIEQYDYANALAIARVPWYKTAEDGSFRIVIIPGPVLLTGTAQGDLSDIKHKRLISDPKYPQYFPKDPRGAVYLGRGRVEQHLPGNFCKVLEIKPDAKIVRQDIVLEHASALPIRIRDAEGKPLPGVLVAGSGPWDWGPGPLISCEEAECAAYQLERGMPRVMVFYHCQRHLAGMLTLKGNEKAPVTVKLDPTGSIKGRLLDADGKPLAGVEVDVQYGQGMASAVHKAVHRSKQIVTDSNGTFMFDELIPELKLELIFRHGRRKFARETKPAEAAIQVKPDECRDLGAIKLQRVAEHQDE